MFEKTNKFLVTIAVLSGLILVAKISLQLQLLSNTKKLAMKNVNVTYGDQSKELKVEKKATVTVSVPSTIFSLTGFKKNISTAKPNEKEFMLKMKTIMDNRKKLLEDKCKKYGIWNHKPLGVTRYVLSTLYNLTYCFIPKAGSSNWKKIILMLNGHTKEEMSMVNSKNLHSVVAQTYRFDSIGIPPNTQHHIKLLVVRHPFHRLLSSYNDKFGPQLDRKAPQYARTSERIHDHYALWKNFKDTHSLATFEEFIRYISDARHSTKYSVIANHWSTYDRICQPCSIKYDVIAHLETIQDDSRYLLNLINAPKQVEYPSGYSNHGSSATNSDSVVNAYQEINSQMLRRLYKAYKLDFELFGYSLDVF